MTCTNCRLIGTALCGWLWALASASRVFAITPGNPGPAAIAFTVNAGQDVKSISPYIYGMNFFAGSTLTNPVTLDRLGGNRWSAYNWETNASNAGKDYKYENDNYLVNGLPNANDPGAAILGSLQSAAANNRALIVSVPMAGYVSGDMSGPVALADFAPSARFKQVKAKKSSVAAYVGKSFSLNPNAAGTAHDYERNDGYVFTDEFVNWVKSTRNPSQTVFYDLDNEPALWGDSLPPGFNVNNWDGHLGDQPGRTHPEVHPFAPTFAEMKQKTIDHAIAIKDVDPTALVFGGVGYGYAEFTGLQGASDFTSSPSHPGGDHAGELNYYEYLLQQVRDAEIAQPGQRKLMDVLDLHWYPEAQGGGVRIANDNSANPAQAVVDARVQAPRSLWDPTYTETSWITDCCSGGPIKLLPNVQRDIDDFNPGTKIAVTEYNYGGTNHISGAIAEADVLGIFGHEGVFAGTFWSLYGDSGSQFASAAFKMFLNYNGTGGKFGDTSVNASTDNIAQSAVYSSLDSSNPNRMVVVAINRTNASKDTSIAVTHDRVFDRAEVYQLTDGDPNPNVNTVLLRRLSDIDLNLLNAFHFTMPAYSVSTLVLISDGLPGDYNHDHVVDAADYDVWKNSFGQTGNMAADGNENNIVDAADYTLWRENLGRSEPSGSGSQAAQVPEPAMIAIFGWIGLSGLLVGRRGLRQVGPTAGG